jgi:1,4-dihydroxy-2-naphthoyl-CoA synthase
MSDKTTLEQLKDIKGLLVAIVAVIMGATTAGGFVLNLVIDKKVATALSAQDLGTDAKIVSMDTNIASNTRTGEENTKDIQFTQQQILEMGRILMRPPGE